MEKSYNVHIIMRIDGVSDKDEALTSTVCYMHEGVQDRADWEVFKIASVDELED